MLDQSMPGQEGAKSRLANVIAALQDRIKALPASAVVGLWTFDGHEGRSEVASGPLADPVGGSSGQPRSAALLAALDKQYSSGGGAVSFTTLRMIYQDMQANYRAGQTNSLLVITSGPHRPNPGRSGATGFHPQERRPGQADRGERHRFRGRSGPIDVGSRRPAQRRQLPEHRNVGVPGARDGGQRLPG